MVKDLKGAPKVLDLFCGCGGLSYGLEKSGFEVVLGIDNWKPALETFSYNHPSAKVIEADITKIGISDIENCLGKTEIDVIVGGPPCQGFSLSGPRKFYDPRNRLYLSFIRLVKELSPKAFIIENVPGLAGLFKGRIKERIVQEFERMHYSVNVKILNASDYGVPQSRKRILFVGVMGDKKFEFPYPTHFECDSSTTTPRKRKVTVSEAISDLPELVNEIGTKEMDYPGPAMSGYQKIMRAGSKKIYNHLASRHTERTKEIISLVPEGGNYKNLPEHLRKTRNFNIAWTRLHNQKPSPTIDTGHRHHFHPTANRVPTVREAARIQSFPDCFKFLSVKTFQYRQVGNAVPPMLAAEIGKSLLKYI